MNRNYRNLAVWQKSRALVRDIYEATRPFPPSELFGLAGQMRRASISIPCNVAEAMGRNTRREAIHFLMIARGSVLELETQIVIASDLDYLTNSNTEPLLERTNEIGKMLNGLIRHFRTAEH